MIRSRTAFAMLAGVGALAGLYLSSLYNFLLFHSLAELFSIVIAACIFIIAWHSRGYLENTYLLVLGPAYLFVGGLDLLHTLSYEGMGVMPEYGPNLPTQLWIAARYLESLSLLAAPFLPGRKVRIEPIIGIYALLTAILAAMIFVWGIFPDCFVPGVGLTPFKKISEYLICLILAGALIRLHRNRDRFDQTVYRLLAGSILLTILGELSFTAYVSVYGSFNLLGHLFKAASFCLIYKAFVETGFETPHRILYNDLARSREQLAWEAAMDAAMAELAGSLIVQTSMEEISDLVLRHGRDLTGSGWGLAVYVDNGRDIVAARIGDPPEEEILEQSREPGPALSADSVIDGVPAGRIILGGRPKEYRDRDRHLAERLADLYALAIQRRRREADERRRMAEDRGAMRAFPVGASVPVSRHALGQGPLRKTASEQFSELVRKHGEILEKRLEKRAYKVGRQEKDHLQNLAEHLGFLRAGPRDVVEIHMQSLEEKSRGAPHKKAVAYADEGRLMALELMGHLAAYYRLQC